MTVAELEADFPDDELVVYRNHVFGFEALIAMPKAKIAEQAKRGIAPLWRHGDTITVRPAREGEDAGVPLSG